VLTAVHEEADRVAQDGLEPGELARTVARMSTHLLRDADTVLNRALHNAVLELQRGDASIADDIPRLLTEVTEEQVRAAAASLVPDRRALVEVVAGGAS
jgi:predicted Zn-dependent peptidase